MAVTRVSSATGTSATSASFGTSPTAGNLLILVVATQNGSSIDNTVSTPTGWTVGDHINGANGTNRGSITLFWKEAAGGDANPTFTVSGTNVTATVLQEWSGLAATSPVDITFTGAAWNGTGTSISTSAGTTVNATDWIYSAVGGRGTSLVSSWGGGQTTDTSANNTNVKAFTSTQSTSSAGSFTPSVTLTAALTGGIIAFAFKQAASAATISGTASATLGTVTAAASGTRTTRGVAAATLGVLAAAAAGTRTESAAAAASLGGMTAAASGVRTDLGTAAAPLGGVTASAVSTPPERTGTAAASLGGLTAAAVGTRTTQAVAAAALGTLIAAMSGTRTTPGSASASLGALTAAATGISGGSGVALADLGALIAAAIGTVTGVIVAPVAGPFEWGFQMLAPGKALIPVEAGLDFIEWGFVMLQPGDALIGDPA